MVSQALLGTLTAKKDKGGLSPQQFKHLLQQLFTRAHENILKSGKVLIVFFYTNAVKKYQWPPKVQVPGAYK